MQKKRQNEDDGDSDSAACGNYRCDNFILVSRLSKTQGKIKKKKHLTVPFPGCSAMHIS